MITEPMLAAETPKDLKSIRYPVLGSYKLDGIRAVVMDGIVLSRRLRPIPSAFVQRTFGHLEGFDGELGISDLSSQAFYRETYSVTMTQECEEPCVFYAFDYFKYRSTFEKRNQCLHTDRQCVKWIERSRGNIIVLEQRMLHDPDELLEMEAEALENGLEGLIVRDPRSPYKMGRSTAREGWMFKIKRTIDSEARILDFEEMMHNANEKTRDARGKAKRSSHRENLVPMDTLGALICEDLKTKVRFRIGIFKGFSRSELKKIWDNRFELRRRGTIVKYAYFPYGIKNLPRHARLIGFRSKIDL